MGNGCCCCIALDADQSVYIDGMTGRHIKQGPGWKMYAPWNTIHKIGLIPLTQDQYIIIKHNAHNNRDVSENRGPHIANDESDGESSDIIEHISGPTIYRQKDAYATISQPLNKIQIAFDEYAIVSNTKTGLKKTITGPQNYMPLPYETVSAPTKKISLNNNQYVHITDSSTGKIHTVQGPINFHLEPFDKPSKIFDKIVLTLNDYVKIVDNNTGVLRVEKGPDVVILNPYEVVVPVNAIDKEGNVRGTANIGTVILIDDNTAVHIKDIDTGIETLVTESQKYIPPPNIIILGVRKMIKLAPYQSAVIVDKQGSFIYKYGNKERGFFIPPFCNLLTQQWSADRTREHRELIDVQIFDSRPDDIDFEFVIFSKENTKIKMLIGVYWKMDDLEKMVRGTNDPRQDICNNVRSDIISLTCEMTTQEILELSATTLSEKVMNRDKGFYEARGVSVSRINILGKSCASPDVEATYKQINDEKIIRVKELEKQKGENDKKKAEIQGQVEREAEIKKLLTAQEENARIRTRIDGQSEGRRIAEFFESLGDIPQEDKMRIYLEKQHTDRLDISANKIDTWYVTPKDIGYYVNTVKINEEETKIDSKVNLTLPVSQKQAR